MKNVLTIIRKELARVFTDKGLILSLFLLPPLTIYLIYGLMGMSMQREVDRETQYVPTVYIINAPEEIVNNGISVAAFLDIVYLEDVFYSEEGIIINHNEEGLERQELIEKVNQEKIDLLIIFPEQFEEKVAYYMVHTPPNIEIYYNFNNQFSQSTHTRFSQILMTYIEMILSERFQGREDELVVFNMKIEPLGDEVRAQGQFLAMLLPMLIVIYLMAGAMGIGIESVSGEKERGTIATLLVTPIKRSELAVGKIISISIIGLLSSIASFIGLVAVLPTFAKMNEGEGGLSLSYGIIDYIMLLSVMVLAVFLFVGLIVIVSAYAKTVKQAGTLIMPVYLVVIGAAMFNMFSHSIPDSITSYIIPIYNIILALKAIFMFEMELQYFLATIISTFVYAVILVFLIQKMFKSEKIMFNK